MQKQTFETLIDRYGADIAKLAEEETAANLADFASQVEAAGDTLAAVASTGEWRDAADELFDAATYLRDAVNGYGHDQNAMHVLLTKADKHLDAGAELAEDFLLSV